MFAENAKVSLDVIRNEFGGWAEALQAAGLGDRYAGKPVSDKMRQQLGRSASDETLLAALRMTAQGLGRPSITVQEFADASSFSAAVLRTRFGSWKRALDLAGLSCTKSGKRYTDEECFNNLAAVWTHYGRQPQYLEMRDPPSTVGPKAYVSRWGTWRKAVLAFVAWSSSDEPVSSVPIERNSEQQARIVETSVRGPRSVPDRLRFKVFTRDRFRCIACGRSPATHQNVELHADHKVPWAKGGRTEISNLQTLCEQCNLGKGDWTSDSEA